MNKILFFILYLLLSATSIGQVSQIESIITEGDSLLYIKQHNEARILYNSALSIAEKNYNDYLKSYCIYKIGYSYLREDSDFLAMAYFTELQLGFNPKTQKDSALNFLINIQINLITHDVINPKYDIKRFEQSSEKFFEKLGANEKSYLMYLTACVYKLRSDPKEAIDRFSILFNKKISDPWLKAAFLRQLMIVNSDIADFQKTILYAQKKLSEENIYTDIMYALLTIMQTSYRLKKNEQTIVYAEKIIDKYYSEGNYDALALKAYTYIAASYRRLGKIELSESFFRKAESCCVISQANINSFMFLYIAKSRLNSILGQNEDSIEMLERALIIKKNYNISMSLEMQLITRLAILYRKIGNYEKSIKLYKNYLKTISEVEIQLLSLNSQMQYLYFLRGYYHVNRLYFEINTEQIDILLKSHEGFKTLLKKFYSLYDDITEDGSKLNIIRQIRIEYENLFLTAMNLYRATSSKSYLAEAFSYVENGKAILLKTNLKTKEINLNTEVSKEILDNEKLYKNYIQSIKFLLNENNIASLTDKKIRQLNNELPYAIFKYDSVKSILNDCYAKQSESNTTIAYSFQNIQKHLNKNQVVLDYFITEGRVFVISISKDNIVLQEEIIKGNIRTKLLKYKNTIEAFDPFNNYKSQLSDFKRISYSLYEDLLMPFGNILNYKELLIIPDKEIGLISFEALIVDSIGSNFSELNYLVKHAAISELYSVSQLFDKRKYLSSRSKYVGFAPDYSNYVGIDLDRLPWAEKEVGYARKYFRGNVYIKESATKEQFFKSAPNCDITHLALHTRIDIDNPDFGQLLFSNQESPLTLYEIHGIPFKTKLMVLSGCSTGEGIVRWGEGVLNLSRGFILAGVSNIIITKWQVSDQSSYIIMSRFYEAMHEGLAVNLALQKAKKEFLKYEDPTFHHPKFWAGHALLGNPINIRKTRLQYFTIIIILIAIVGLLLKKSNKKR